MDKNVLSFFIPAITGLLFAGTVSAKNLDSSYLRIFTPYHDVKGVFSNSAERQFTDDEIDLIAKIVQAESNGEPFEGKVAVASVVLNRLNSPNFPKSIYDIVYQKNAFSCIKGGKINAKPDVEAYKAVNRALSGDDPTENALFFYNPKTASNKWMKSTSKYRAVIIGNHVFFR
ncbi:MAG: cell wall hydrolase [Clostridiales bacterium]|nr:cell wall hydrolase [Clostridiales bacterium]